MFRFTVICWAYVFVVLCADNYENVYLSTVELIRKYGYPVEIYSNVVTEDLYLLDIYRIPHGRFKKKEEIKKPVLLMHGLWRTSEDFLITGPERSLGFLLADRGYDVWLGNARGSPHSRKHLTLNPDKDTDYWEFSWHEIGLYDLPAMFQLIRNVTNMEHLYYVGLSEGNTYFYVLTSIRPEYNNNVTIMISLAPIAYMVHVHPLMKFLAAFEPISTRLTKCLGIYEGQQIAPLFQFATRFFCTQGGFFQNTCRDIIFLTAGYSQEQTDTVFVFEVLQNGATGAFRQLFHHAQNINSGDFKQFDFGRKVNLKKYGSPVPPSYNLSKITSPVALFYSDGDRLSTTQDVERLSTELGNCVYKYKVPFKQFGHYDIVVAKDVVGLLYQEVFKILNNNK